MESPAVGIADVRFRVGVVRHPELAARVGEELLTSRPGDGPGRAEDRRARRLRARSGRAGADRVPDGVVARAPVVARVEEEVPPPTCTIDGPSTTFPSQGWSTSMSL